MPIPYFNRCFLLALLPMAARAQQAPLTGVVTDATTAQPVPFAVVELLTQKAGVQADLQGRFSLELSAAPVATDSLTVSALGYSRRRVPVPGSGPVQLVLSAAPVALAEVQVRPAPSTPVLLGATGSSHSLRFSSSGEAARRGGHQIARFFPATAPGYFQSVGFYMDNGLVAALGPCDHKLRNTAPFRVRLYAADGPDGAPGTDLLNSTLLTAATRKTGWHTVDLRARNLRLPATGFYVAMEWVFTDAKYLCEYEVTNKADKTKKTYIWYGQFLEGTEEQEPLAWSYTAGRGWHRFPVMRPGHGPENPMIQALVLPD
ncbi:carboxypeptidase-like regulatory domain-containing protein [Hymenobacter sp. M29]|uniref:Carboxypeptidase-like regulatory domain-containing protein n=1 Tax=Hymenobacter mellowenesis TaxID=3063995 RepID=A0ABT9A7M0_9BACT|nr:carboxypeptidase-like regulatory domain-containing protein [Hymenobacter sp. M29]MDO7845195.1 carboxypeptidase-like regulatory domain-containing protein [Hymenobacter sp. M29]